MHSGNCVVHFLTQTEYDAGLAASLIHGFIAIIDDNKQPIGIMYRASADGPKSLYSGWSLSKRITMISPIDRGTSIDVNNSTTEYIVEGDSIDLGINSSIFNENKLIMISLNGVDQEKGIDIIWDSITMFKFNMVLDIGDIITILV